MSLSTQEPLVSIVMGSDSDLPIMQEAAVFLEELSIPHEVSIVSAHRTPERLFSYSQDLSNRSIKVILAGAGGAAHLPGMIASLTPLPVIGVPIHSRISLDGWDSVLSILQMPPGIPVATVALNGAKNAGILAAQILGTSDPSILDQVTTYKQNLNQVIMDKIQHLEQDGFRNYLKKKEDKL